MTFPRIRVGESRQDQQEKLDSRSADCRFTPPFLFHFLFDPSTTANVPQRSDLNASQGSSRVRVGPQRTGTETPAAHEMP